MKTNSLKSIVFLLIVIAVGTISCSPKKASVVENAQKVIIEGNYVNSDYKDKDKGYDWIAVMVNEYNDSLIQVSVRSRADKKKPTCTFDAKAVKQDSTGFYKAMVEGNSVLFLFSGDSIVIKSDPESGYSNLNYFCSGGASIEGVYSRLSAPLDTAQIDKVLFRKSLNYDKFNFFIEVYGKTLTIEPTGLTVDNQIFTHEIEGTVMNAEIGDLNIDGYPEVLVYIQSVGSGSYGSVIGYSVNNGKSLSQIAPVPEVSENPEASAGYMGHDEFAIVENTFIQRFPVYKPGDSNAKPTGGMRQIQYKLYDGEASRKFVVDKIVEY